MNSRLPMPIAIQSAPNGIMPGAMSARISRPNQQVCDRLHAGLSAWECSLVAGLKRRDQIVSGHAADNAKPTFVTHSGLFTFTSVAPRKPAFPNVIQITHGQSAVW